MDSYDGPPSSSARRTDTWRRRTATAFAIPCARTIHGIPLSHRVRCIATRTARATVAAAAEWWSFTASSRPRRDESQYVSRANAGDVSEQSCHGPPSPTSHARTAFLPWYNARRSRRAHAVVASNAGTTPWVHAYNSRALRAASVVVTVARLPPEFRLKLQRTFSKKTVYGTRRAPPISFFLFLSSFVIVLLSHIVSFRFGIIHRTARAHIYILLRDISQAIIRHEGF